MPNCNERSSSSTRTAANLTAPKIVLVLGASGQLGRCMVAELQQRWPAATLLSPCRAELDLSDAAAVLGYLEQCQPDWLINCAAYTAVDAAEQDPQYCKPFGLTMDAATHAVLTDDVASCARHDVEPQRGGEQTAALTPQVAAGELSAQELSATKFGATPRAVVHHPNTQLNAVLPQVLAQYWRSSTKPLTLLHFSTDYVYSGQGDMPWREDATLAAVNAYGRAKASGDAALLHACQASASEGALADAEATAARLYIVRTSWVYHRQGHNFINTMLKLARERDVLRVVDDQVGAPTPAPWAAQICALLLPSGATSGVYHLAPAGATSWYGVAFAALSCAANVGLIGQMPELIAIASLDYPLPAKRPLNSRLDCQKLQRALGVEFAPWQVLLRDELRRWSNEPTSDPMWQFAERRDD